MKRFGPGGLAALILLFAAGQAWAAKTAANSATEAPTAAVIAIHGLKIETPWARATPPGATVGAGYLRIVNNGKTADRLIGVSAPIARKVGVHETIIKGTVAEMREVSGGLAIPPEATVTLAPGSYHLMFEGLKAPFKQGARVEATLDFEKAGKVPVEFAVRGIGAGAPQPMHMH